jgi:beta-glucosidase
LKNAGYTIDSDVQNTYAGYLDQQVALRPKKSFFEEFVDPTPPIAEYAIGKDLIRQKAAIADIAIIAIGRNAGEQRDRNMEGDYLLTDTEVEVIKNITAAFHAQNKKVVAVLNIGGVIDVMPWRDDVDAILLAWQPGLEGGNAIADILGGKVNPSGKLATTFPVLYSDVPSAKNFPGKEFPEKATTGALGMKMIPGEVTYEEGIYVGYRYYNTFKVKPAYAFGYGLSYTNFAYGPVTLSSPAFNGKLTAFVTITNTGKVAGKEVVQLYISAPAGTLDKPESELKAFAKTILLQPGASQTLTFPITASDLASYHTGISSWMAEAGKYAVKMGASSMDIKQSADFNLSKEIVVEKANKGLEPQITINELKR